MTSVTVHGEKFVPYISSSDIDRRVYEIAQDLEKQLSGTRPVALCVLNGAFMFYSDLLRCMNLDCELDFIKISSYGKRKTSSKDVQLVLSPSVELSGRTVILIEDIVDSGYSMEFLKAYLIGQKIDRLIIVSLLHKPDCTVIHHELDYVGFIVPAKFVIGYGLDYDQHARQLSSIYILDDNEAAEKNAPKI
jgi:hypoxanthine phosphoribosyltransferase